MTALGASLAPITEAPFELVARRRFSRLGVQDERDLAIEIREATSNLARLKQEAIARNPHWGI